MTTDPDALAKAGADAIEAYFTTRGTSPVTAGDGRFTVYVPGGEGTDDLQLSLASTPASRGILARVKSRRAIAPSEWPAAGLVANRWNRSSPLPHVVLATRGDGDTAVGTFLIEGFLPPSATVDPDQVRRFAEAVVAGARQFWASPSVRHLARPLADAQPAAGAPSLQQ